MELNLPTSCCEMTNYSRQVGTNKMSKSKTQITNKKQ